MSSPKPAARVIICRSNPVSPDPRVEKAALVLAQNGYEVEVIGWDRSGRMPGAIDRDRFLLHLYRKPAAFGTGMRNLPALLAWQWFLLRWLFRNRKRYRLIHACDFDTILPALMMKVLAGKKVVYDVFDFYADHIRNTPFWIKNIVRRLERWCIAKSDAVILVDEARRQQLGAVQPRRVAVIYNSPLDVGPVSTPPMPHAFRLVYVGLLVKERGFDVLFSVLRRHPDWTFDLAGFGGDEESILASAASLPNVHWQGRVDYVQALQLSEASDVLFALYDPSIPNHRLSSPNKVFEAMMLSKPIVVSAGTHMDDVVQATQCGLVVPYGDIPALEQALLQLCEDETLRSRLGANGRTAYVQQYSWKVLSKTLLNLYRAVLTEAGQ